MCLPEPVSCAPNYPLIFFSDIGSLTADSLFATISVVLASTPSLHLSNEYFPQADQFIPERWIPEESPFPSVQEFTFYPFSAGTRNCVGKNFAMMEMRLILATIITQYDIKDVPGQRTDYVQFITTALATGSYMLEMNKRT